MTLSGLSDNLSLPFVNCNFKMRALNACACASHCGSLSPRLSCADSTMNRLAFADVSITKKNAPRYCLTNSSLPLDMADQNAPIDVSRHSPPVVADCLYAVAYILLCPACRSVVVFIGKKLPVPERCEPGHSGKEKTTAEKRSCNQCFRSPQLWKEHSVECHPQKLVNFTDIAS